MNVIRMLRLVMIDADKHEHAIEYVYDDDYDEDGRHDVDDRPE